MDVANEIDYQSNEISSEPMSWQNEEVHSGLDNMEDLEQGKHNIEEDQFADDENTQSQISALDEIDKKIVQAMDTNDNNVKGCINYALYVW